jgi:NADH-quinone oxidoreductase subunit M
MVFLGAFSVWPWATGVAAFGVVLAAGYTLWMVQQVFFGERPATPGISDEVYDNLTDANWVDMIPVIALAAPIFIVGIWPSVVTDMFDTGIQAVLR